MLVVAGASGSLAGGVRIAGAEQATAASDTANKLAEDGRGGATEHAG